MPARAGLVGRVSACSAGHRTAVITSFTFFSVSNNLVQSALQYHDLKESQSDAQPCKCIGKTFVQAPGVGAVAIYLSLVFQPEFIHASECIFRMGPEQPSQALLPNDSRAVARRARPGEPRFEFYLLCPHQQTQGLPGFGRSL